jgi:hypothetical protein
MKEMFMNKDQREIQRKLRILRHADETGHVAKTCRHFAHSRKDAGSIFSEASCHEKWCASPSGLFVTKALPVRFAP